MNTKYDDEIREVESRLMRNRQALVEDAHGLTLRARDAAASPKGLLAAFVVGYVLGELLTPRRRDKRHAAAATTKKVGLSGLIGSAVIAYVRSQYGSPWALGRRAWDYYAASQARRAATPRSYPAPDRSDIARPAEAPSRPAHARPVGPTAPAAAASAARVQPLRTPESHAAS